MIFESHAHYEDERFDSDRVELLSSMEEKNIGPIINVGSTMDTSRASLRLSHEWPFIYAAIGVHPSDIDTINEDEYQWLRENTKDKKVVSIGEIGLDYYWEKDEKVREEQRFWFSRQTDLAAECSLPVIIHSRDACEDTLKEMRRAADLGVPGVMHCFGYSPEVAREYVDMGYYIGIGGVVTFKNGKKMKAVAEQVPLERILVETDSPYLTPEPFRGSRNDSTYLPYIVKAIAQIKQITEDEVIEVTAKNARKLFSKVRKR